MNDGQLMGELTAVFRDIFDNDAIEIAPTMTARDIKNWDSLNHINLIVAVEKRFGVKFTTKEIAGLADVGSLISLVQHKVNRT